MADIQSTRLGRNWVLKMSLFLLLLFGFGCWGLVDALWIYKHRGLADASVKLRDYLAAAESVGKLHPDEIKVAQPRQALAELAPKAEELRAKAGTGSPEARQAELEFRRHELLLSLARAWQLGKGPVEIDHPRSSPVAISATHFDVESGQALAGPASAREEVALTKLLPELKARWDKTKIPTPLAGYDMPVQWIFVVVGFGGGLWIVFILLKASRTKYSWDGAAQRLTLPDGKQIVPSDVKEFDKRRWHRFFVTINTHDGRAYVCDLLRYQPLEEWVLEMERTAFPDAAAPADDAPPAPRAEPEPSKAE